MSFLSKRRNLTAILLTLGLFTMSCSEQYCLDCIHPGFNDRIEGCRGKLSEIEQTVEELENQGYVCITFER